MLLWENSIPISFLSESTLLPLTGMYSSLHHYWLSNIALATWFIWIWKFLRHRCHSTLLHLPNVYIRCTWPHSNTIHPSSLQWFTQIIFSRPLCIKDPKFYYLFLKTLKRQNYKILVLKSSDLNIDDAYNHNLKQPKSHVLSEFKPSTELEEKLTNHLWLT